MHWTAAMPVITALEAHRRQKERVRLFLDDEFAFDLPLMEAARRAGARVLGGLWMLVYQGAASFEMWTAREAPVDLMYEAGLRALGGEP